MAHPSKEYQNQVQDNKKIKYPMSFKDSEEDLIPKSKCLNNEGLNKNTRREIALVPYENPRFYCCSNILKFHME